tara:strand:- start:4305 stop:4979 length:675 start_codon:yes stop_codon:yes gene_type:complete
VLIQYNKKIIKLAIFDLDNTILKIDSDYEMVNYLIDKDLILEKYRKINEDYFNSYEDGSININNFSEFSLKPFVGMNQNDINLVLNDFYFKIIEPAYDLNLIKRICEHKKTDQEILLASATNSLIVSFIANKLGFKNFISSKVIFKSGRCTGMVKQPHALGEGKLKLVKKYCRDFNFSLNNACFYSDSKNDLPLLEAVYMPIAVNPDKNLKKFAKRKNWMIINS